MNNKNLIITSMIIAVVAIVVFGGLRYTGMAVYSEDPLKMWGSEFPSNRFFYLADEKGFFENEGVNVKIREIPDEQAVQAYVAGELDFLHVSPDWYAILKSQGVEGRQILFFERAIAAEGLAVNKNINSAEDLKGKKVALWEGTVLHFQFLLFLEQNGINKEEMKIISLPPNEAMIAFISGNVDAAAAYEPWLSQYTEREGAKLLYVDEDVDLPMLSTLVVSEEAYNNRKEDVEAFVKAFFRAVSYHRNNQEDANRIMGKSIGITGEEFKFYMDRTHMLDYEESLVIFRSGLAEEIMDKANEVWMKEGIIENPLPKEEYYDASIIENLY